MAYQIVNTDEYLSIGSVPLSTPAWEILDLSPLWDMSDVRGQDRLIPGEDGVVAYPRRPTVSLRSLPLIIFGSGDPEGASVTNQRRQLFDNIEELIDTVFASPGGDGTRTATLHLPGSGTLTGPVHVLGPLSLSPVSALTVRAVLDLSIPAGRLFEPSP